MKTEQSNVINRLLYIRKVVTALTHTPNYGGCEVFKKFIQAGNIKYKPKNNEQRNQVILRSQPPLVSA